MSKKIEFAAIDESLELPKPARTFIPEWYKKADRFVGGDPILGAEEGMPGRQTIKLCVPFLDTLTSGYMVELWQDLQVVDVLGAKQIRFNTDPYVATARQEDVNQGFPVPFGCSTQSFAWNFPFLFKVPKGYSILITHPFNRFDLPFITTSGIVDADNGMLNGNAPFWLSESFQGIIPKGTPIAQIFPFKRDNWESLENKELLNLTKKFNPRSVVSGWYKKTQWHHKTFK
jgi:hypothetical protein